MWKDQVLKKNEHYRFEEMIYTGGDVKGNEYVEVNKKEGGTDFYSRSKVPGTHSYFDTHIIYKQLEKIFKGLAPQTILDVGCGDGRTVVWFLEHTSADIIAVDCSFESLLRLKKNYLEGNEEYSRRVLLVHSNILKMPLADQCCDFIWAFEVYCYLLADYEQGMKESLRTLKNKGYFATAERNKAFGLLHELLNRGPQGMIRAYHDSTIIDVWNEENIYTKVYDQDQIKEMLKRNGLTVRQVLGVSYFSLITAFLKSRGLFVQDIEENAQPLAEIYEHYSAAQDTHRSTIYLTQKD